MISKIKVASLVLLFLLLLVAGLLLMIQTPPFKSWLAANAGKAASRKLNADVVVGSIHGNFIRDIELREVTLSLHGDTIVFLPKILLRHSPQNLLRRRLVIDSLIIENPQLNIYQRPDSSWVFSHFFPTQKDTTIDKKKNEPGLSIDMRKIGLTNGKVQINSFHKNIPEQIDSLNLSISALIAQSRLEINLDQFSLKTQSPNFEIKQLTFSLQQDNETTKLEHFVFRTGKNQLVAHGDIDDGDPLNTTLQATVENSDPSEFSFFIPALAMLGKPSLSINANAHDENFQTNVSIISQQSRIFLSALVKNYSSIFEAESTAVPAYELGIRYRNVNFADLMSKNPMSALVNGDAKITGVGITKETAHTKADILFFDSTIEKRNIDTLRVAAAYKDGKAAGVLHLNGPAGNLDADFTIKNLWDSPNYTLLMSGRNIDAHHIFLDDRYASSLNVDITAHGAGFDFSNATGVIAITMDSSTALNIPIDAFILEGQLSPDEFQIDSFLFDNPVARLNAEGIVSREAYNDVQLDLTIKDPMPIAAILSIDTLAVDGNLSARLHGKPDSLLIDAILSTSDVLLNIISLDSLHSTIAAQFIDGQWAALVAATLENPAAGSAHVERIQIESAFKNNQIDAQLNLAITEGTSSHLRMKYHAAPTPLLEASEIQLDINGQKWRGEESSIRFGSGTMWIDNFSLYSDGNGKELSAIEINGKVSSSGDENLHINIKNMALALPVSFMANAPDVNGDVDFALFLEGTAENPIVNSKLKIRNGRYKNLDISLIDATAEYVDKKMHADIVIAPQSDSLNMTARLPITFTLSPPVFQIDKNAPLDLRIVADQFPIEQALSQTRTTEFALGDLTVNLHAAQSLANISPKGFLQLENGRASFEPLGALFENIGIRLNVTPDSLVLKKLSTRRGKGTISATGFALPSKDFTDGFIDAFEIKLDVDRYMLSTKPENKLQVSSKLVMHGAPGAVQINGDVQVLQSSFYLPALLKESKSKSDQGAPLLVQALSTPSIIDTVNSDSIQSRVIKNKSPDFFKNMRGAVHVSIPKNTWIKSENMRVELAGNLDILKASDNFSLSGEINVLRGQIDYLGRRFLLTKGKVHFQNREQIDPDIDIAADYRFRDVRNKKRSLTLSVSGSLSTPKISFVMDGEKITNEDAVSYILFQRAPGELGLDEQANTSAQTEQMAANFLYSMASASLSRRLGASIGLDYMEIKGRENWNSATFVMGKYLTPDLFISYEHSVGSLEEDHKPQVMTIEYELTKYLFLQLVSGDTKTTGVDLIFKLDK